MDNHHDNIVVDTLFVNFNINGKLKSVSYLVDIPHPQTRYPPAQSFAECYSCAEGSRIYRGISTENGHGAWEGRKVVRLQEAIS
jgi:hypothetical protein